MPWLPIYDTVIALLVSFVLGTVFFSAVILYNKLCEKDLLASTEDLVCCKISRWYEFVISGVFCIGISCVFCYMIFLDAFDFSLIFFIPPLLVAIICELKNGFVPLISAVLCGLCVLCRILFYCALQGVGYGLSIILSFALAFILVLLPKIIFRKNSVESVDILYVIVFSLVASYFSPIYALVFTLSVYLFVTLFYELLNYISNERKRENGI